MKQFNLRVYGLLLNENNEILISEEVYNNHKMTKFPGGGLEWGESFQEALKREFHEELNWTVEVGNLFYLTDFFQVSAFNSEDQLISVYYWVHCLNLKDQCFPQYIEGESREKHRWIKLSELNPTLITFPIDKIVAQKLSEKLL